MRCLANLYTRLQELDGFKAKHKNILDLFCRKNFYWTREAIDIYTIDENDRIKAGLKQNLYFLLKRSSKILRGLMLEKGCDDTVKEITDFVNLLELWDDIVFGDAQYETNKRREVVLRRPGQLPDEEDMLMLKNYLIETMEKYTKRFEFVGNHDFVELRDAVLTRLTILNGRREGEPSRLEFEDWEAAKNDDWVNKNELEFLDDFDMALVNSLKITYITGKG